MHTWKAIILGCGQIAGGYDTSAAPDFIRTHVRAYAACPETNLTAVMDVDPARAHAFAECWQVPRHYHSLEEILHQEQPELVSICTPDGQHADDLQTCLGFPSVRAIWCEKPLTLDVAKAENLVAQAQKNGIILAVNYQRQWEPAHQELVREIRSGTWGKILGAHAAYSKGILHNGSHLISLLRGLLGEPEEMHVHDAFCEYSPKDPTVDATLIFSGIPVRIVGLPDPPYPVFELTLYAEGGTIRLADSGKRILRRRRDPAQPNMLLRAHETETQLDRALHFALEDICGALREGRGVLVDGNEALQTLKLCSQLAQEGLRL